MIDPHRSDHLLCLPLSSERQFSVGVDLAGSRVWIDGDCGEPSTLPAVMFGLEVSRHQQTSLVLELGRVESRLRSVFGEITRQEPTEDRVADLLALDQTRTQLCQWIRSLATPGACVGLRPYYEDEQFRERIASQLSALSGIDSTGAVYRELGGLQDLRAATEGGDEIWTQLDRIDAATSDRGVQIAVRVLLNPPPNQVRTEGQRSGHAAERLRSRLKRAADLLVSVPSPRQWTTRDLYAEVHRELWDAEPDRRGTVDSHISASARALVTRPRELEQVTGSPELGGHPNEVRLRGWALYRLFRQARYGGVIYPHATGDTAHLVNPWVDSATVDESVGSYRRLWREALFYDGLLGQVFEQVASGSERTPLRCPLCAVSVAHCGGETCGRRTTVARANRQLHELVSRLRTADDSG
ncbi:hypothetical protein [Halorientalis marina]|jgi:hypothetical protein|uniref:hypothetical protein n=1 Tax=Halorientalis marina TaxID=2931976 RepID=UPI001FF649C3|nr:hypothetical protein [Halorientalis marina]